MFLSILFYGASILSRWVLARGELSNSTVQGVFPGYCPEGLLSRGYCPCFPDAHWDSVALYVYARSSRSSVAEHLRPFRWLPAKSRLMLKKIIALTYPVCCPRTTPPPCRGSQYNSQPDDRPVTPGRCFANISGWQSCCFYGGDFWFLKALSFKMFALRR